MPNSNLEEEENAPWQAIREENIFIHDGLLRSAGILPNPFIVEDDQDDKNLVRLVPDSELETFLAADVKSLDELSRRLLRICTRSAVNLNAFHDYEFAILRTIRSWRTWKWRATFLEQKGNSSKAFPVPHENSKGYVMPETDTNLSSKLGMLLIVPLLKSQASLDRSLAMATTSLLFDLLTQLSPMSLSQDFGKPLDALEDLLLHWLSEKSEGFEIIGPSTVLALSCARGLLSSFLKAFELLMMTEYSELKLPLKDVLIKLAKLRIRVGEPCALVPHNYMTSWPYNDQLYLPKMTTLSGPNFTFTHGVSAGNVPPPPPPPPQHRRTLFEEQNKVSIGLQSGYLYASGAYGHGLSKIGTGYEGTVRGYVYATNTMLSAWHVAVGNNLVLIRCVQLDAQVVHGKQVVIAEHIRSDTLGKAGTVYMKEEDDLPGPYVTIGFTSDGRYFYLLRVPVVLDKLLLPSEERTEEPLLQVYLDIFEVVERKANGGYFVNLKRPREVLIRNMTLDTTDLHRNGMLASTLVPDNTRITLQGTQVQGPKTAEEALKTHNTTLNIDLMDLMKATIFCCGNYVTVLTGYDEVGQPSYVPPLGVQVLLRHLTIGSSVPSHGKGTQMHIFIGGNQITYSKQDLFDPPTSSAFFTTPPGVQIGACYDYKNNMIWTSNGQRFDMWKSTGHTPTWYLDEQHLAYRIDDLKDTNIEASKVLNCLMTHVGRMASHFTSGARTSNIGFEAELIVPVLRITNVYVDKFDRTQLGTMILVLQALVSQIRSINADTQIWMNDIQTTLCHVLDSSLLESESEPTPCDLLDSLPLLESESDSEMLESGATADGLIREIGKLYAMLFEYSNQDSIEALFQQLDGSPQNTNFKQECLISIRNVVLTELAFKFRELREIRNFADKWIVNLTRMKSIMKASVESVKFDKYSPADCYDIVGVPVLTPETLYLSALTNYYLETQHLDCSNRTTTFSPDYNGFLKAVINSCAEVVEQAIEFAETVHISTSLVFYLENVLKTSMIGTALPQILLHFVSHLSVEPDAFDGFDLADDLVNLCASLTKLAEKINCDESWSAQMLEDWSSQFKRPPMWQAYRFIESDHPLKESTKVKETITIPSARRLFVKFDQRCSTRYDLDRFSIFAGSGTETRHVDDYYGIRSRPGMPASKWPTDLVQIEGDTMSYSFESRSGRERNATDSSSWGFAFTVYPVYDKRYRPSPPALTSNQGNSADPVPCEMGFINKVTLCSIDAMHSIVLRMLEDSEISEQELMKIPKPFISNRFLTTFDWLTLTGNNWEQPSAAISKDEFAKLSATANRRDLPKMRSKMTNIIKPGLLQRLFVKACLKALAPDNGSSALSRIEPSVIQEIFRQIEIIIRKLVSLLEMQVRIRQEVQDIVSKAKEYDDAFFNSTKFLESPIDIANICTILEIPRHKDGQNIIRDIYCHIDSCIKDGAKADISKAEELVEETHLKCMGLIAVGKRSPAGSNMAQDIKEQKEIVKSVGHFVASQLNEDVDSSLLTFTSAVAQVDQKSARQCEGLRLLLKLLQKCKPCSHLVLSSALLLKKLSALQDCLAFTRYEEEFNKLFGQGTKSIVEIAETNPLLYRYSVFLLSIWPYKRSDETSLVESGLLGVLDKLCALQIPLALPCEKLQNSEPRNLANTDTRVASLAWAAFQVLASTCSSWGASRVTESIALPVQISMNVTNHLNRASSLVAISCSTGEDVDSTIPQQNKATSLALSECIEDVLLLLDSIRETRLGHTILRQSPCICRLLSLLQDPRLSPRLIHIILRLLRSALPLSNNLNMADLAKTTVPFVKRSLVPGHGSVTQEQSPHQVISSLLLSKLADFLICINQHPTSNAFGTKCTNQPKFCIWIHKQSEQTNFSESLRALFEPGLGKGLHPLIENINEAQAVLNQDNKAKVDVDDKDIAEQKAIRLAEIGFVVSLEPFKDGTLHPTESLGRGAVLGSQPSAKTREYAFDHIGKERNSELANCDTPRPFLSGEAAESLAAEVIRLLHALLASKEEPGLNDSSKCPSPIETAENPVSSESSKTEISRNATIVRSAWAASVEQTLCSSLKVLPKLSSIGNPIGKQTPLDSYGYSARLAIASLCVLGSFTESIRLNADVWIGSDYMVEKSSDDISNWDYLSTPAKVISINRNTGTATVEISEVARNRYPSRTVDVPINRLTMRKDGYPNPNIFTILSAEARHDICRFLRSLFTPSSSVMSSHNVDHCPIKKQLPTLSQIFSSATASIASAGPSNASPSSSSETKTLAHGMTVVRLVAEIRTRAAQVLSIWLKNNQEFVDMFLGHNATSLPTGNDTVRMPECLGALHVLKRLALECKPSHRLESLQAQVTRLRLLYRDCTKPPKLLPPSQSTSSTNCPTRWDYARSTPIVRNCVFRNDFTGVTFAGEPSSGVGNPRGVLLFANKRVPAHGFYFEVLILNEGDSSNYSSISFALGLLPFGNESGRDGASPGAWQYPLGGVMFHSTNRFVHYVGTTLISWKSEKVEEYSLKIGDTIGLGWEPASISMSTGTSAPVTDTVPLIRARPTGTPRPTIQPQRTLRARISNVEANPRGRANAGTAAAAGPSVPAISIANASSSVKGYVFLTLNGKRLGTTMHDVQSELWPCFHLQKTNLSIDANFGDKPFLYADGRKPSSTSPDTSSHFAANQINDFFTPVQLDTAGPSGSGGNVRRFSESLQDLGVHFGNLTFYPLLDDEDDSDSEASFPEEESVSDSVSEGASPLSSQTHMSEEEFDAAPSEEHLPVHNAVIISSAASTTLALPALPPVPRDGQMGGISGYRRATTTGQVEHEQDRVATAKSESKDYHSNSHSEYHLMPSTSFDIRVFSGPNRYFCPCTEKNDSELDMFMIEDSNSASKTAGRPPKLSDLPHVEGEDIYNLLVRAWETRVFPTIRRRFRNEAERRDGLEQIRGALQLGMIDIARQTVEFLYEEGNGVPRDLHFPTLEEIRLESARFTLERIHPGVTVNIRTLPQDTENEAILPKYGVSPMLRTFGLSGEVLDVDIAHELVLVETYVETEGLILRFWYPLKDLDKPTSVIKPQLNSTTVNMLKLHSILVSLESMLCRNYCRQAFLQILDAINEYRSADSLNFSKTHDDLGLTSLFQELDLENLQVRSEDNFADMPTNGDLLTRNLGSNLPSKEFLANIGNSSCFFYKDSSKLSQDLSCTIIRAASQGEDYVDELTNQICAVMKESPSKFVIDTIPLDKAVSMNISLPEAAFTAVCFSGPHSEKNVSMIRGLTQPCVHLYGFNGGDSKKYPLACFPILPLQTWHKDTIGGRVGNIGFSVGNIGSNRKTSFVPLPHILVPVDKIFCSITSTAMKENFLEVQGIPSQFPLALLYSQLLIGFATEHDKISESNIFNLVCVLTNFLERVTLLPLLKEWIFATLSEAVNLLKTNLPVIQEFYLAHSSLIYGLFKELIANSRKEISDSVKFGVPVSLPKSVRAIAAQAALAVYTSPQAGPSRPNRIARNTLGIAPGKVQSLIVAMCSLVHSASVTKAAKSCDLIGRLQEFPVLSSYFQMLAELSVTLFYVVQQFSTMEASPPRSPEISPVQTPQRKISTIIQGSSPIGSLPLSHQLQSSSGASLNKGKTDKSLSIGKQTSKTSITENPLLVANQRYAKQRGHLSPDLQSQMLEVLNELKSNHLGWFSNVYVTSQILQTLIHRKEKSSLNFEMLCSFIKEATTGMHSVTNHSRIIVISNAPNNIHEMSVETSVIRALNETGGLFGHELWISPSTTDVVIEIRTAQKAEKAIEILKRNQTWYPIEDSVLYPSVSVHSVDENLDTGDITANAALKLYLNQKIFSVIQSDKLCDKVEELLAHIFTSCFIANEHFFTDNEIIGGQAILFEEKHLLSKTEGNLMEKFIIVSKQSTEQELSEFVLGVLKEFGQEKEKGSVDTVEGLDAPITAPTGHQAKFSKIKDNKSDLKKPKSAPTENFSLSLDGFIAFVTKLANENISCLWKALFAAGYDMRFDRTYIPETTSLIALMTNGEWTKEQDAALILYIDRLAETLRIPPQFIHPHEIHLEQSDYSNPSYSVLAGVPAERIRSRCAILQLLNLLVAKNLLPYIPLHLGQTMKFSTAALLREAHNVLFYHLKDEFLYKVLQFSSHRGDDITPPELFLDPVQMIGSNVNESGHTMFCSVLTQLQDVPSALLASRPATGGDPPLPLIVKFVGEEVHGLIGSFRHFIASVVQEVKGPTLQLLIKCPSSDAGRKKDSLIFRPGPLTMGEEKILSFLGQFIGLSMRADAPLSYSLASTVWRSLLAFKNEEVFTPQSDGINETDDLDELDILTSTFLKNFEFAEDAEKFNEVLEDNDNPAFVYLSMDRTSMVPLCKAGDKLLVSWENRDQFIQLVKQFRRKEMISANRVNAIQGGLATLLPMPAVLNLFSPRHLESRVCGPPDINLSLLKAHTHYQVGTSSTDLHILYFWAVLESMTPEQLKDFVKFACNQARLPATCPCQNQSTASGTNLNAMIHVPPFPMILTSDSEPGSQNHIDKRNVRAETCLFLLRLPRYSCYKVTREKLLFACNSRDDPLSG